MLKISCRYQNTLKDLEDCFEHMTNIDISEEELGARVKIIRLCAEISDDFYFPDIIEG